MINKDLDEPAKRLALQPVLGGRVVLVSTEHEQQHLGGNADLLTII